MSTTGKPSGPGLQIVAHARLDRRDVVACGTTPPVIVSVNWKPEPRGSGLISITTSPNWPWPPDCFLWRPRCWTPTCGSSRGRGSPAAVRLDRDLVFARPAARRRRADASRHGPTAPSRRCPGCGAATATGPPRPAAGMAADIFTSSLRSFGRSADGETGCGGASVTSGAAPPLPTPASRRSCAPSSLPRPTVSPALADVALGLVLAEHAVDARHLGRCAVRQPKLGAVGDRAGQHAGDRQLAAMRGVDGLHHLDDRRRRRRRRRGACASPRRRAHRGGSPSAAAARRCPSRPCRSAPGMTEPSRRSAARSSKTSSRGGSISSSSCSISWSSWSASVSSMEKRASISRALSSSGMSATSLSACSR